MRRSFVRGPFPAILAALLGLAASSCATTSATSGSGGGVSLARDWVAELAEAQPTPALTFAQMQRRFDLRYLKLSGGTLIGDVTGTHFYTSLTGATGVVYGPSSTHGLGFDTSSQSLVFLSGSAEQWRISGASGDFVSTAGIDRNVTTAGNATFSRFRSPGVATGSLPTCNAGTAGSVEYDTTVGRESQCDAAAVWIYPLMTNASGGTVPAASSWDGTTIALGANVRATGYRMAGGALFASQTAPTISSGFGTSPSVAANNGTIDFTINVGTGGVATSGVIGLPATASNGWMCGCEDITTFSTTVFRTRMTAQSATSCTVGNFNTAATAAAWVASDILHCWALAR